MKSAVENLSPTRVKLIVEVPFEELKPDLDKAYAAIGQQIQIPGFRRGKVPARIIDQRVGRGAVVQEAVNDALPRLYSEAVDAQGVRAIGSPEVDITSVPMEDGQDFEFSVETEVRPEVELPDLTSISVEVDPITVTETDVAEQLQTLQERFGTLVEVARAAQDGDHLTIDLAATVDGEPIDSVEGISYVVGSQSMLPGLDEAVQGASAGDVVEFVAPLAGGEYAGQDADCTVTVQVVKERELPELDDDFAQLASEFDTLDELRVDARAKAEDAKRTEQVGQARDKVLERLLELTEIPVPDGIVAAEVDSHLKEENREEDDEHRVEVDQSTRESLKTQFLLDALAEKLEVSVEQRELIEYLIMNAQQYGMDPNQFAQALDNQGQVPAMVHEVARRKALAAVLEQATVTDTDGEAVDVAELVAADEDPVGSVDADDLGHDDIVDDPYADDSDLDELPAAPSA